MWAKRLVKLVWILILIGIAYRACQIVVPPAEVTWSDPYWVPPNGRKVEAVRNMINRPGLLGGGAGGLATTDLGLSLDEFKQEAKKNPFVFFSIEKQSLNRDYWIIYYLTKTSENATHSFSARVDIPNISTLTIAGYRITGDGVVFEYRRDWDQINAIRIMIITVMLVVYAFSATFAKGFVEAWSITR